jgi:spermidine synthase
MARRGLPGALQRAVQGPWGRTASRLWSRFRWPVVLLALYLLWDGWLSPPASCTCAPRGSVCVAPLSRDGPEPFVERFPVTGTNAVYRVRSLLFDSDRPGDAALVGNFEERSRGGAAVEGGTPQRVRVFDSGFFGRILAIDEELMLTEKDEMHYHEMMAHVPMVYAASAVAGSRTPLRVLIVGGGDGGVLREVLRYDEVTSATLVDIDEMVVNVSRKYFPQVASGFADRRANVVIGDGAKFVRERAKEAAAGGEEAFFDVVIVDSTDFNLARSLFTDDFYAQIKSLLNRRHGVLVFNVDSVSFATSTIATAQQQLAQVFRHSFIYQVYQPTYLSGHYGLLFASDKMHPFTTAVDWASVWTPKKLPTYYYNPDLHYGKTDVVRGVCFLGCLLSYSPPRRRNSELCSPQLCQTSSSPRVRRLNEII